MNAGALHFEDFVPGALGAFGPRRVSRDEIVSFATEFDPQAMHLDESAGTNSMLGGLSGSGWHLASIMMRMMYDGFLHRTAWMGMPGISQMRWVSPLRADDDLMLHVGVAERELVRDKPHGTVSFECEAIGNERRRLLLATVPIVVRCGVGQSKEQG